MDDKNKSKCECKLEDPLGTVYCKVQCNEEERTDVICYCKGFLRSNRSHHCEVSYNYFDYDGNMGDIEPIVPLDLFCENQKVNKSKWAKPLKCEKNWSEKFDQHVHSCSVIPTLNTSMAHDIATSDQKTRLEESEGSRRRKYPYTEPTKIPHLATSRLVNEKKQTTGVSNDARTHITEGTFTVNTNIPEEKNVTTRKIFSIQSSNSNRVYEALKTPFDSLKLTGGAECGLLILGILIIGFISLMAYLGIRKRVIPPSNSSSFSLQDDNRGKHDCNTRVTFQNGASDIHN